LATTTIAWFLASRSLALSLLTPKCNYDSHEVLWFSVTHSNLLAVSGNGSVGVWNFSTGEMRNQFTVPANELTYPGNSLAVSRGRHVALATLTDQATLVGDKLFSR